jgi:hypothetical protein
LYVKHNAQERALGGKEIPHAKAVDLQIVFELPDVLLDAGALVVVAPQVCGVTSRQRVSTR